MGVPHVKRQHQVFSRDLKNYHTLVQDGEADVTQSGGRQKASYYTLKLDFIYLVGHIS